MSMEKGIFSIDLVNRPRLREGNGENNADSGWFDYGAKGFIEVDTRLLRKTTDHPSCFVACKRTIGKFVAENPFPTHDIGTGRRRRDESLCFVKCKSIKFFLHGMPPTRVTECEEICVMMLNTSCWETPRGRYDEHNSKFSLSKKPRFNRPVGERPDF
jgi:hypothetical protein